jgi:hypothetical protein
MPPDLPRGGATTSRLGVPVLSLIYPSPRGVAIHALKPGTTTIGRAADNDLVLADTTVADHHVVMIREGDRLALRDLLSGKTFVNEIAARGGELKPGDVVRMGEARVRVAYAAPGTGSGLTASLGPAPGAASPPGPATSRLTPVPAPSASEPDTPSRSSDAGARMARERDARRSKALARTRQLSDEVVVETDIEALLKRIAVAFVEIFDADRGVCLLLEEDGRNPLLTVEKRKDGSEEGAGVAREIIDTCLKARTVVRIPPPGGDKRSPGGGFAAPLISGGKAIGLLFFERGERGAPFEADDVHLMALITNQTSFAVARILASG